MLEAIPCPVRNPFQDHDQSPVRTRKTLASVLFGPDGATLYRTRSGGTTTLTLVDADGRTVGTRTEPSSVAGLALLSYRWGG